MATVCTVVFPLVPVAISQVDKGSTLGDTDNDTVLYDAGQLTTKSCAASAATTASTSASNPASSSRLAGTRKQLPLDAPLDRTAYLARHVLTRRSLGRDRRTGGRARDAVARATA